MGLQYYTLIELVGLIDPPNRVPCQKIVAENYQLFQQAPGSTHNHQAWTGGYWDHVTECMNIWMQQFGLFNRIGRMNMLPESERFTCGDGLLVLFLHDIEKPWRCQLKDGKPIMGPNGQLAVLPGMEDKEERKRYAQQKITQMGVRLTPAQSTALKHVEGLRDSDYSPRSRVMTPLAAMCHTCDLWSARVFYDFPRPRRDAWAPGRVTR